MGESLSVQRWAAQGPAGRLQVRSVGFSVFLPTLQGAGAGGGREAGDTCGSVLANAKHSIFVRSSPSSFSWGRSWRWVTKGTGTGYPGPSASQQTSWGQRTRDSRAPGRARRCSWGHTGESGSGAGWCHRYSSAARGRRPGPHTEGRAGTATDLSPWGRLPLPLNPGGRKLLRRQELLGCHLCL